MDIQVKVVPNGMQDIACREKQGRERCPGIVFIPTTAKQRAAIRGNEPMVRKLRFSCGHTHTVTITN